MHYHPTLQCGLHRIDVKRNTVTFHIPPDECTDMRGAIQLATAVCPGVKTVRTIAGTVPDTTYKRERGTWLAIPPWRPSNLNRHSTAGVYEVNGVNLFSG